MYSEWIYLYFVPDNIVIIISVNIDLIFSHYSNLSIFVNLYLLPLNTIIIRYPKSFFFLVICNEHLQNAMLVYFQIEVKLFSQK